MTRWPTDFSRNNRNNPRENTNKSKWASSFLLLLRFITASADKTQWWWCDGVSTTIIKNRNIFVWCHVWLLVLALWFIAGNVYGPIEAVKRCLACHTYMNSRAHITGNPWFLTLYMLLTWKFHISWWFLVTSYKFFKVIY